MVWRVGGGPSRAPSSPPLSTSPPPPPPSSSLLPSPPPTRHCPSRNFGELGFLQSLLPLHGAPCSTSHVMVGAWACCELYHGSVIIRASQDR
ncbi:hypothetical protein AKJ16_DCAP07197 [Drosera capensis]